jgi:hypothetical protein
MLGALNVNVVVAGIDMAALNVNAVPEIFDTLVPGTIPAPKIYCPIAIEALLPDSVTAVLVVVLVVVACVVTAE